MPSMGKCALIYFSHNKLQQSIAISHDIYVLWLPIFVNAVECLRLRLQACLLNFVSTQCS